MDQSMLSTASMATADGRMFDAGKINQLFDKIGTYSGPRFIDLIAPSFV